MASPLPLPHRSHPQCLFFVNWLVSLLCKLCVACTREIGTQVFTEDGVTSRDTRMLCF
ncbi:hypothetical protein J6590_091914 [Homalodisca vitripennis]|nr:hypothetical protein J6590_091914 [Homalodisca vitripennis]